MSSLEGAWLITNRKLDQDTPGVTLHTETGKPYACVGLGASGNYVRVHSAEVARGYVAAFAKAVALLEESVYVRHDSTCCMNGIAPGNGPHPDCPGADAIAQIAEPYEPACSKCGAADTPLILDPPRCHNAAACAARAAVRAAARDAEAAKVTR